MIAFGPVPSRRLGRSLGINNIPPKICTYSCIYCQVGKTTKMQAKRRPFYAPESIFENVRKQVDNAKLKGETIDYLTFVPDGEPTLDLNLGCEIDQLKTLGIKVGVITNGSLIDKDDVKADLMKADWVSLKLDSIRKDYWYTINRPFKNLRLGSILRGMIDFSHSYSGELVTETMLIRGKSNGADFLNEMAMFIDSLSPSRSYLAIPTRPPTENWVRPPSAVDINTAYQVFQKKLDQVEYLIGYEGDAFAFTGNAEDDLLSIASVHPMRLSAVSGFLKKSDSNWDMVHRLIVQGKLVETVYEGQKFYLRNLSFRRMPTLH